MATELPRITFTRLDGSTFSLQPQLPASMMARFDLLNELATYRTQHDAKAKRVVLAGLGMTLTGQRPDGAPMTASMPAYRLDGEVLTYGGQVGDHLMTAWGLDVTSMAASLYQQARDLCMLVIGSLPTKEGVQSRKDFTSASEGASTG
jgi:hypothetical protein